MRKRLLIIVIGSLLLFGCGPAPSKNEEVTKVHGGDAYSKKDIYSTEKSIDDAKRVILFDAYVIGVGRNRTRGTEVNVYEFCYKGVMYFAIADGGVSPIYEHGGDILSPYVQLKSCE